MARILVVEDEELMRDMLAELFKDQGHNTATASNGIEALKAIEEDNFDLIVTDIVMPEKDGLSVILQTKRDNKNIKVIAISGGDKTFSGKSYLKIARNIGVERTIDKPFKREKVLQAVEEVLASC
jgi:YesN/AraC family two-component response regulator